MDTGLQSAVEMVHFDLLVYVAGPGKTWPFPRVQPTSFKVSAQRLNAQIAAAVEVTHVSPLMCVHKAAGLDSCVKNGQILDLRSLCV